MALDEGLVTEVRAARVRMEDLEDSAWDARARFHQAVRRLHHAGASLREIAAELGMSHQRVHQIVGEDAVIEVQEPRTATVPATSPPNATDDVCCFCEAARADVERMLTGPGGASVCGGCIHRARQAVEGDLATAAGRHLLAAAAPDARECSFCRNARPDAGRIVERGDRSVRMCVSCLEACERMLAPAGAYTPKGPATKRKALARCSFCNVSQKSTKKLIAGPGVYTCEVCIAAASAVIAGTPSAPSRSVVLRPNPGDCAFCGKTRAKVNEIVGASRGRICNECLDLCHDILHAEGT